MAQKLNGKMATIVTSTGTQVRGISVACAIELTFFLSSTEVSVFLETGTVSNLILGIGQETTVLTTLPFLVVSCELVPLSLFCLLNEVQHHGIIYVPMGIPGCFHLLV